MREHPPQKSFRPLRFALRAGVAAAVLGAALLGLSRAPSPASEPPRGDALVVRASPVQREDGYTVHRSFVGRVEARRRSEVGFELAGTLATVHGNEGDVVERGAVLAELDTQRLQARRAELRAARERARADLALAEATARRRRALFEGDAASAQQLDEAERAHRAARAGVLEADAALEAVEVDLRKSRLAAPYDSLVAARRADEGQVVAAGEPVLVLLERTAPEARIGVAGGAIDGLAVGQTHTVRVGDREIAATLRALLPVRERGTRTVDAILALDTAYDGVRAGDLAVLEIESPVDEPGFWLPLGALTESARGLWACYVAETLARHEPGDLPRGATHRLARRELEVLHETGESAYVRGTLADGEKVVVAGLHRLVPGLAVRLAEPETGGPAR